MQGTKSLQNSWEKLEKLNRLVKVKRQKIFFFRQSLIIFPVLQKLTHIHYTRQREKSCYWKLTAKVFARPYLMERSWIFISLAVRYDKCLKLWAHAWFPQSWSADCGRGDPGKAALAEIFHSLVNKLLQTRACHLFWRIVWILFFISRFYSMSGKVSVSAALPLSYLFQTGALETRIVNCTVFSQTHAECTKKWVNHFLPNLNHNQWPCVLFRGGLRKQLWEEIFFSAGTGRERSEKTQTDLQNSHHRSACGLRYLVVSFHIKSLLVAK